MAYLGTADAISAVRNMNHRLDPYPIPKDKTPLYINEPWLIDKSLLEHLQHREPEEQPDNIRIYIPMDLNQEAILRQLDCSLAVSKQDETDTKSLKILIIHECVR